MVDGQENSDEDWVAEKHMQYVVIDFTLCSGFDGSLIGGFQRLAALGCRRRFNLCLTGVSAQNLLWLKTNTTNCPFSRFRSRSAARGGYAFREAGFMVKEQKRVGFDHRR